MVHHCIYLRKSRQDNEAEARGAGETLARHKRALLELARHRDMSVAEIYEEVVSGETIAARPEMQRLLRDVETGRWAGVLVMEVERLARGDTSDQGAVAKTFQYSGTKIITPMKTFDPRDEFDEEYFEYSLFMSRREYKVINRRMQRGRLASVNEGKYVAGQPPYGYERVKLERQKGWTLREHPEESDVVRTIFDLYTSGQLEEDGSRKRLGIGLIARWLNRMDIPAKKGGLWAYSPVREILTNPVYIGKVRWNRRPAVKKMVDGHVKTRRPRLNADECILVDGLHEGIIDSEVFARAQELIGQNPPRPTTERTALKNPLGGIIYCGRCGRSMIRRPSSNSGSADTLMCAVPECKNVSTKLHFVEERLLEALEAWMGGYKLKLGQDDGSAKKADKGRLQADLRRRAAGKVRAEIESLKKQQSKTHDLLEQGVYDADTFFARSEEIARRLQKAELEQAAAQKELNFEQRRGEIKAHLTPRVEGLTDIYRSLESPTAKNDLLGELLERAFYLREKGGRWHSCPDDFELTLYPRLPMCMCDR